MSISHEGASPKARPILFSAPMIRALINGRKTQTRRIVKPGPGLQSTWLTPAGINSSPKLSLGYTNPDGIFGAQMDHPKGGPLGFVRCPYGKPGDLLWCRETWKVHSTFNDLAPRDIPPSKVFYFADDGYSPSGSPNRPSIFMPRWASRLTLELTGVRVERLNCISELDAYAEGINPEECSVYAMAEHHRLGGVSGPAPSVCSYSALWESINGKGSWEANPFVWVLEFRVHQQNIDALLAERRDACQP